MYLMQVNLFVAFTWKNVHHLLRPQTVGLTPALSRYEPMLHSA